MPLLGFTLLSCASSNLDFRDCGAKTEGCCSPPSPGSGAQLSSWDWLPLSKMGCLPFFSCSLSCEFLVPGSLTSWEQGLARGRAGPTSLQQEGWECGSFNLPGFLVAGHEDSRSLVACGMVSCGAVYFQSAFGQLSRVEKGAVETLGIQKGI